MNVALIFAGGTGERMSSGSVPKQFLELHGKPIIIYTIEHFEHHSLIDDIFVVCVKGWEDYLRKKLELFNIRKVKHIYEGGKTAHESIREGVYRIHDYYPNSTVVLVHDGVRPLISEETITRNIEGVERFGSTITVVPATETVLVEKEGQTTVANILDRSTCRMARAPQSFFCGDLYDAHVKAEEKEASFIDTASLMMWMGKELHLIEDSAQNIKITTPTDYYLFRAIMDAMESRQINGL